MLELSVLLKMLVVEERRIGFLTNWHSWRARSRCALHAAGLDVPTAVARSF